MNAFLCFFLCAVSVAATAQSSRQSVTNTQIDDNGKTMSVRVEGQANGRTIDYQHTFDVARLNDRAKDALKDRIFDALGIGPGTDAVALAGPPMPQRELPTPPLPPVPPVRTDSPGESTRDESSSTSINGGADGAEQPNVTFRCESCTGKIKLTIARSTGDYSFERDTKIDSQKRFFPYELPLPPGDYRLYYVQNDVLQIQSTFTVRVGEENTVTVK